MEDRIGADNSVSNCKFIDHELDEDNEDFLDGLDED